MERVKRRKAAWTVREMKQLDHIDYWAVEILVAIQTGDTDRIEECARLIRRDVKELKASR